MVLHEHVEDASACQMIGRLSIEACPLKELS